jgi:hypothetical protein
MIGPPPQAPLEAEDSSPAPTEETKPLSDAAKFRKALLGVPSPMELDFLRMKGKNMSTWLMDTPLFNMLQTAPHAPARCWQASPPAICTIGFMTPCWSRRRRSMDFVTRRD